MFGFTTRKMRKLGNRVDRNAYNIQLIKDCCRAFSDQIEDLKNFMEGQQEQINELRRMIEKEEKE